ncbi:MAG: type 2 isopentenyl-diphosphate Delta-isomerase [Cyanobacteriota bacterium]
MTDSPSDSPSSIISERKQDHLDIVLQQDVSAKGIRTGFERFFFEHVALPELHLEQINLSSDFLGKRLQAPLLISSMTGGTDSAHEINLHLAAAAQHLGIAMGVGSQRAALEHPELAWTYQVRKVAPDILLLANLGAVQLNYGYGLDQARRAVEMIEADGLILHLNPLQEAVQPHGDPDWCGLYGRIEQLVAQLPVPVVVKEVGNGLSVRVARQLVECGVAVLDVAGAGGTSWSEVEAHRQPNSLRQRIAHTFVGWGIPTALSLLEIRRQLPDVLLVASGGIRNGIDVAKAIRLGANLVGMAAPVLQAVCGAEEQAVIEAVQAVITELRIAAFCTGSADLTQLKQATLRRQDTWDPLP